MGMIEVTLKRARSLVQILTILATVALALDLHPADAQLASNVTDHDHTGVSCDSPDLAQSPSDGTGSMPSANGDCTHHLDSLLRQSMVRSASDLSIAEAPPYAEPHWQLFSAFDPPPPRILS